MWTTCLILTIVGDKRQIMCHLVQLLRTKVVFYVRCIIGRVGKKKICFAISSHKYPHTFMNEAHYFFKDSDKGIHFI